MEEFFMTDLEAISSFNLMYQCRANGINKEYSVDDCGGVDRVSFYEVIDLEKDGFVSISRMGAKNTGSAFFEKIDATAREFVNKEFGCSGFNFSEGADIIKSIRKVVSKNEIQGGIKTVGFSFLRWWIKTLEEIKGTREYDLCHDYVKTEIKKIECLRSKNNYKSGWGFYKYKDSVKSINNHINNIILKNTHFLYNAEEYPVAFGLNELESLEFSLDS